MKGKEIINHIVCAEMPDLEQVRQKCHQQAVGIVKGNTKYRFMRTSPVLTIVLILCLFTATVVIGATFKWHEALILYFNPSEKQMEEVKNALHEPDAVMTHKDVTIKVLQTITTQYELYILYEISTTETFETEGQIFQPLISISLDPSFKELDPNSGSGMVANSGATTLEHSSNKLVALYRHSQSAPIPNHSYIKLNFFELILKENALPIVDKGYGDLIWQINFEETDSISLEPNLQVILNDNPYKIAKIVLTPLSVYINIEGEAILTEINLIITLSNGKEIHSSPTQRMYSATHGYNLFLRFDELISPDEIKSITIEDVTIPIYE